MKIFILEDSEYRMKKFRRKFMNHTIYHFFDAIAAVEFLKKRVNDIDYFFLDHDLDGRVYVPSEEENTGYTVAKYLSGIEGLDCSRIIIHSLNAVGVNNMHDILKGSHIVPFINIDDVELTE